MDAGENTAWRRRPDCTFEVKDGMLEQCGVQLHWVRLTPPPPFNPLLFFELLEGIS